MSDSRLEKYINAILSMEVSDLPAPLSRNETYLMAILGLYDIDNLPAPLSRVEKLLYEIATTITVTPSVDLSYSFMDETSGYAYGSVALSSNDTTNDGTYTICWADANGKLNDYKDIASFTLSGSMVVTYEFISTNIIPKEATRVVAIKDGLIKASYRIEANRLNTDTKLYSIGLLSDIHIDVTDDQSDSVADFQRAINRFKTENVIAICSTGDTVVDGSQEETEKFIEIKNSANIPMYIARGNHDCRNYTLANWNLVEPNGVYFEKEIGGDIYLFMGMNAESFNTSLFTTEQLNWLEERLEYYKNRRVFLFEHVFIEPTGNIKSLYPYSSMGKVEGQPGQMFRNLMAKYRNVILFTGHSHLEFILQRLGDNANCSERTNTLCHRVHIPSCAKPRANDESTEDVSANTYQKYGSSEGYVMDVYQDYIILKGINFVNNKYLPLAQYRINTIPIIDGAPTDESLLFYLDGSSSENTTSLIKDLSGNGNDFVANDITLDTTNGAINFNGSSSYLINETLQPVLTADDIFSVEFIVDSNAVRTGSQSMISIGTSSPNRITYRYKTSESSKDIFTDYGATNNIDITDGNNTDLSKKRHIVIIRKNGYIACYVDGAYSKQCVKAADTTTIEPRTVIGAKYNHTANFFSGNIYMCKLYTRELSAEEILEKYNDIINIQYATYKITNALETLSNTKEKPIKSVILKGSTKYRDNDTQEVLDTFKDGRNLELVSAKKLILKTSNEGGTKTNILTVSSDATLRKIGTVQDEFNALTGEITERIGEIILNGSEDWIVDSDTNSTRSAFNLAHNGMMKKYEAILCDKYKPTTAKQGSTVYGYVYIGSTGINLYEEPNMSLDTFKAKLASNPITIQYPLVTESTKTVDLSIINQNGNNINTLNTFSDITRIEIKSEYILPEVEIEVAINKN